MAAAIQVHDRLAPIRGVARIQHDDLVAERASAPWESLPATSLACQGLGVVRETKLQPYKLCSRVAPPCKVMRTGNVNRRLCQHDIGGKFQHLLEPPCNCDHLGGKRHSQRRKLAI